MSVYISRYVDDVLDTLSSRSDATILAGGTDLLVEINFGRIRPAHIVAIDRVEELNDQSRNGHVRMGALVTYTRMLETDVGSPALQEAGQPAVVKFDHPRFACPTATSPYGGAIIASTMQAGADIVDRLPSPSQRQQIFVQPLVEILNPHSPGRA